MPGVAKQEIGLTFLQNRDNIFKPKEKCGVLKDKKEGGVRNESIS